MGKSKLAKLNSFLLFILLFFGLFDVARNYTKLLISFGYLKDMAIYILFIINLSIIKFPKRIGGFFYLWAASAICFSVLGFFNANYSMRELLIACFKFLEIFILVLLFFNWDCIFSVRLDKFIKYYIIGAILLCFVNVFGYFVDNPIVSVNMPNANMPEGHYGGRVTVGQPPIAIFPVLLAFIYLMIYASNAKERILLVVFMFCIFMATSNTGLLAVSFIFIILIIYAFLNHQAKNIKLNLLLFIVVCISGVALAYFIFPNMTENIINQYINKIGKYLSGSSDASMDIRVMHWQMGLDTMSGVDYFFGRGVYGYIKNGFYPIENTFVITFLMYGAIGTLGMVGFFVQMLYFALGRLNRFQTKNSVFFVCVIVVFLMHMFTLDLYMCYTLYFSLTFFIAYCYNKEKKIERQ